ncbi:hypothetical protein [Cryptosporangium phraense]|uniref:Uncharacterized protein n=1 Tax=Cryptosporangium phraense TaxID=2593070 RepID=A0A545AKD9_9ACTN|nr:hypothetical protein [Cryptosporangium phraense]TQS41778.1 hypothetical protein FL583_27450 [Cryptosporangium phraense]
MASARQLVRTERLLDRVVAGLLAIGALGGLFAAYHFLGEIALLHRALRAGDDTVENIDPGTALPTVYVLGGYAVGFALLFAAVAILILRASSLGAPLLRAAVPALLPATLLAFLAAYIRYQEYVDAMPPETRDAAYRGHIFGQIIGGGIGAVAVVATLLVLIGAAVVRWFRPAPDHWEGPPGPVAAGPLGPPASALNAGKILALTGTAIALVVPVAWVRPVGDEGHLPSEWSLLALLTGFLAVAALVAAGLTALARPARLTFRYAGLGALVVVGSVDWVVTLWESFYADVAFGTERVAGVAVPWTAAIACGLVSSALLTAAAVALTMPPLPAEPDEAPTDGPRAGRLSESAEARAARRVGESSPEPRWQAFPEDD